MELDKEDEAMLTQFESINKDSKEIEFDKIQLKDLQGSKIEYRRIPVPRNRFTPLR